MTEDDKLALSKFVLDVINFTQAQATLNKTLKDNILTLFTKLEIMEKSLKRAEQRMKSIEDEVNKVPIEVVMRNKIH